MEYIDVYGRSRKRFNAKIGIITPDELISEQARKIKDQQELIDSLRKMIDIYSKQQENLEYIASYYKAKVQIGKTMEELAELIQALARGEAGGMKVSELLTFIKRFGYKVSDEEQAIADGTHELYK